MDGYSILKFSSVHASFDKLASSNRLGEKEGLLMSRLTCGFLTLGLLLCTSSLPASASEQVSIQTLLSPDAGSYQRHTVTIEGVVKNMSIHPPGMDRQGCVVYGTSTFTLDDETGSTIPTEVLGACKPSAALGLPKNGDHVRVIAVVNVFRSDHPRKVRLQATSIEVLNTP